MLNKLIKALTAFADSYSKIEKNITGGDTKTLNQLLNKHPLIYPQRPLRFLQKPSSQEDRTALQLEENKREGFTPWVKTDEQGRSCVVAFTRYEHLRVFIEKVGRDTNSDFFVSKHAKMNFAEVKHAIDYDVLEINTFSQVYLAIHLPRNAQMGFNQG